MVENCWVHKITFIESIARCARTSAHESGTVFASHVNVLENRVELVLINTRSHLRVCIASRPEAHGLGPPGNSVNKFVGDVGDDDFATSCRASLSRRAKCALGSRFDGEVHVSVLENHDGILPAHFTLHLCATSRRLFVKTNAHTV